MKLILLLAALPLLTHQSNCASKKKKNSNAAVSSANLDGPSMTDSIPPCLQEKIRMYNEATSKDLDVPLKIDEYLYLGKKAYLFTEGCCDQFNTAYDDSCRVICSPSGGFTGKGDKKCPDFGTQARFLRTIWSLPKEKNP